MNLIISSIGQGLLWALLGPGLYLAFRTLDFIDMTVEEASPLGAASAAVTITRGINPLLAALIATDVGILAGLATGLLYAKRKIPSLLVEILAVTVAYSINLRIAGKSNTSLLGQKTLLSGEFMRSLS